MKIQLSEHFSYKKLLRFSIPSVLTIIFTSVYGIVDGFFVSNYAGKTSFAAVNFVMPYLLILCGFGFMVGTGGTALIGKTLGEGDRDRANRVFSMLVYISIAFGIVVAISGIFTVRPFASLFGAEGEMLDICTRYGRIILFGVPFAFLQFEFQIFYVVAEKPKLGLYTTLAAGCLNILLDFLLVGVWKTGVTGAAVATVISEAVGGGIPVIYFACRNSSLLRLCPTGFDGSALLKTLGNGASEFVSQISMSVVGMLYNIQLLKYSGEDGIAAYGVLMYVNLIFLSVFIGYATGTAPIVSYHFGAGNSAEVKSLFRKSLVINGISAVLMLLAGEFLAKPFAVAFVGYDEKLVSLTVHAFVIFSFTFPLAALPIYGSSFFTALNNGGVSAAISFLRTLVFQVGAVLLLPKLFGLDGIWYSLIVAELCATAVTVIFWIANKEKYGY